MGQHVGFWTQKNRHLLLFFENGGDGKNDNHILVGSKLIVTWSESTICHGPTIFENKAVKAKTRPSFYSKIFAKFLFAVKDPTAAATATATASLRLRSAATAIRGTGFRSKNYIAHNQSRETFQVLCVSRKCKPLLY